MYEKPEVMEKVEHTMTTVLGGLLMTHMSCKAAARMLAHLPNLPDKWVEEMVGISIDANKLYMRVSALGKEMFG